eukprot:4349032-Alexandrium_andersonii.AAC.1
MFQDRLTQRCARDSAHRFARRSGYESQDSPMQGCAHETVGSIVQRHGYMSQDRLVQCGARGS